MKINGGYIDFWKMYDYCVDLQNVESANKYNNQDEI